MKFMDPRIDFAFKKIFGSEDGKDILISFLESLLELEGVYRMAELTLMDPFLAPRLQDMKYSILDVQCRDLRGVTYIVEMQVQKVPAFLKRIQYNAAKTYVHQIARGEDYPKLNQVIAVTIADFPLFDGFDHPISRHEYRETVTGRTYLLEILHYFIELTKFTKPLEQLEGILDQWIYFIKHAGLLEEVPVTMQTPPLLHAFEKARLANMTREEWELYDKAGIAITDARGMVELAREEGEAKGLAKGLQQGRQEGVHQGKVETLMHLMALRFGSTPAWVQTRLATADLATLERWLENMFHARGPEEIFQEQATIRGDQA